MRTLSKGNLINREHNSIDISNEVKEAMHQRKPIVALESTIISHGLPYPQNALLAQEAEKTVRKHGSIPATIAIIDGRIKVGLNSENIQFLSSNQSISKLSSKDIVSCILEKGSGSTTVAATMVIADLVGISVFATGGIGGVHRNVKETLDVSADLKQLAVSNLIVVCSGPKAILDIPKTIELLETLAVPLITYKTKWIPAFWSRTSGLHSSVTSNNISEISKHFTIRKSLGFNEGLLVFNPVPKKNEIKLKTLEPIICSAIERSNNENITGKAITPYLLQKVLENTGGKSLKANKALILDNVKLASRIAVSLVNQ